MEVSFVIAHDLMRPDFEITTPDEQLAQVMERLVAQGDRLYATLGYRGPLSILDAATGEVLSTVKETAPANDILAAEGVVLVYSQAASSPAAKRRGERKNVPAKLIAVAGDSGEVLWQKKVGGVPALFLAIDDGRAIVGATLHKDTAVRPRS